MEIDYHDFRKNKLLRVLLAVKLFLSPSIKLKKIIFQRKEMCIMGLCCDYLIIITDPALIFENERPVKSNWLYSDCYYHNIELSVNETKKYLKKTAVQEFRRRCELYKVKYKKYPHIYSNLENKKLLVTIGFVATYRSLLCIIYQFLAKIINKKYD